MCSPLKSRVAIEAEGWAKMVDFCDFGKVGPVSLKKKCEWRSNFAVNKLQSKYCLHLRDNKILSLCWKHHKSCEINA